ncbi:MAG TPA: hypothetical protein VFP72_12315, partial [Kineosporiaceae bacterium]|nr:hypothetical protein [Kineosporiaceae bacterium]
MNTLTAAILGSSAASTALTVAGQAMLRRMNARQAAADVSKTEAETESIAVTTLTATVEALKASLGEAFAEVAALRREVRETRTELEEANRLISRHVPWDDEVMAEGAAHGISFSPCPPLRIGEATTQA